MVAGRNTNTQVRDWLIEQVKNHPDGIAPHRMRELFRKTPYDFVPRNIGKTMWELAGVGKDRGYGQRIHVAGWTTRSNERGHKFLGGKPAPIFKFGPGENVAAPPLSKSAIHQRDLRAKERADEKQMRDRIETERRRALKRQPAMDALTAALFGRPTPRSK